MPPWCGHGNLAFTTCKAGSNVQVEHLSTTQSAVEGVGALTPLPRSDPLQITFVFSSKLKNWKVFRRQSGVELRLRYDKCLVLTDKTFV
jgi:hypothetical protein